MNLSSKDWEYNQSEVTKESVEVGDKISYSDICNFLVYEVIEKDDTGITIQSIDAPEWVNTKGYDQLNKRWEFYGEETRTRLLTNVPKLNFGLREMEGRYEGHISRTEMMTQAEADEINKRLTVIRWVCLDSDRVIKIL